MNIILLSFAAIILTAFFMFGATLLDWLRTGHPILSLRLKARHPLRRKPHWDRLRPPERRAVRSRMRYIRASHRVASAGEPEYEPWRLP